MNKDGYIGAYHGTPVYEITFPEYVNDRCYKNGEEIAYLIDGKLIKSNKVFATYDGNYVHPIDEHKQEVFYTVPAIKVSSRGVNFTSSIGATEEGSDSKNKIENEDTGYVSNFEVKDVETTLAGVFDSFAIKGVYETDYFSQMINLDDFLKTNS